MECYAPEGWSFPPALGFEGRRCNKIAKKGFILESGAPAPPAAGWIAESHSGGKAARAADFPLAAVRIWLVNTARYFSSSIMAFATRTRASEIAVSDLSFQLVNGDRETNVR
jgi:hypothetical protein